MIAYQLEHFNSSWGKDAKRFPQFETNETENCKAIQ